MGININWINSKEKESIYDNISDSIKFYLSEIKYFFKNIYRGISNLIEYFPVIWNERDWDYRYMFMLLKKKLQRFERHHKDCSHFESQEETLKYIKICIKLVDEFLDEPTQESDKFHVQYPTTMNFIPEENTEYYKMEVTYDNQLHQEIKESLDKLHLECIHKDYARREKVKQLLFKILASKVEHWWT